MQRDMNLARKILLAIEAHEHGRAPRDLNIDGYTEDQIGYHVLLLGEAGLMKVAPTRVMGRPTPTAIPLELTWDGHDFLDASRSDTVWSKAMKKAGDVGGTVSITVLRALLDSILKGQLGL